MSKVLIIGAGGVGGVVTHKCAQVPQVFSEIVLASRTLDKCERIRSQLTRPIEIAQVDADDVEQLVALIRKVTPDLIINVALPYQDLSIMEACLATGVHYLDTANYEPPDMATFSYKWQWEYQDRFRERGLMALLAADSTRVWSTSTARMPTSTTSTKSNPSTSWTATPAAMAIPLQPILTPKSTSAKSPNGASTMRTGNGSRPIPWRSTRASTSPDWPTRDVPHVPRGAGIAGEAHPGIKRLRFWMTFSEPYLTHLRVLENVGMTRIDPVYFQGQEIVPLQFLKALLPDPASLGPITPGKPILAV